MASTEAVENTAAAFREMLLASDVYRGVISSYLGMGVSESQAISYLLARGPMGQTELASALGVTSGSMTVLIDRLVDRDYVEREPHPTDRRRVIVHLSPVGLAALEQAQAWGMTLFRDIPADRVQTFIADVNAVAARMRQTSAAILDGAAPVG